MYFFSETIFFYRDTFGFSRNFLKNSGFSAEYGKSWKFYSVVWSGISQSISSTVRIYLEKLILVCRKFGKVDQKLDSKYPR